MNETVSETTAERQPVDIDAVREALECGDPIDDKVERQLLALCDEVERLRSPGRCPANVGGASCRPMVCTYGTTAASLGDYNAKFGDSAIETYLGRCVRCGAVYAGVTPGGVYQDEPEFADRVQWVRVDGAEVAES